MFQRIILQDWHTVIPLISFGVAFSTFLFLSLRTLLMKPKDIDNLAHLPLEEESQASTTHHE